jgi:2-amino-4-hydroxy-6-hydroxymethyldihydropteridine diphosphokinase
MASVFVSVGSNVDKEANIRSAVASLRKEFGDLVISTVYENAAVGFDGEDFHNLAVGFDTDRSPLEVVEVLRRIERQHGRIRGEERFSPRTLDLDLLLYGDLVTNNDSLQCPREEISRYAFVLGPLAEIAGDLPHPQLDSTLRELWERMDVGRKELRPVEFSF